jgi:hypothetical protein
MCDNDVCVYDLCDGYHHKDYWADWCPETMITTFGGAWYNIPEMKILHAPSEEEVKDWVSKQGG